VWALGGWFWTALDGHKQCPRDHANTRERSSALATSWPFQETELEQLLDSPRYLDHRCHNPITPFTQQTSPAKQDVQDNLLEVPRLRP